MSLILNALKKAEKDRSQATPSGKKPLFNPFAIEDGEKSKGGGEKRKKWVMLGGGAVGLLLVIYLAFGFVKKMIGFITGDKTKTAETTPTTPSPDDPAFIKIDAIKDFKDGNYEASKQKWDRLVSLTPTDSEVYNNLGVVLKKLGRKDEAREAYRTALSLNPSYPEALNNLGVLLLEKLLTEEATQLFQKALQLNPEYAEPYFHLALAMEESKNFKGALENYQTFMNLSKDLTPELKSQIEIRMVSIQSK